MTNIEHGAKFADEYLAIIDTVRHDSSAMYSALGFVLETISPSLRNMPLVKIYYDSDAIRFTSADSITPSPIETVVRFVPFKAYAIFKDQTKLDRCLSAVSTEYGGLYQVMFEYQYVIISRIYATANAAALEKCLTPFMTGKFYMIDHNDDQEEHVVVACERQQSESMAITTRVKFTMTSIDDGQDIERKVGQLMVYVLGNVAALMEITAGSSFHKQERTSK